MSVDDNSENERASLSYLQYRLRGAQKDLRNLLSRADDHDALALIWSIGTLLRGQLASARRYVLDLGPDDLERAQQPGLMNEWTLETLANQLLVTKKIGPAPQGLPNQILRSDRKNSAYRLLNAVREVEEAEDAVTLRSQNVLDLLGQLAQRQFPWQRGFNTQIEYLRSAYLYGFPAAEVYFESNNGISLRAFMKGGFGLFALARSAAFISFAVDLKPIGIDDPARNTLIRSISEPIVSARKAAATLRANSAPIAYKPSYFRLKPCISFQDSFIAPMPELIGARVNMGLFYDLVGGGGQIREQIGRNFERYSEMLFAAHLPNTLVRPEERYWVGKNDLLTPDLLLCQGGQVRLAVECKSNKASYTTKFSANPRDAEGLDALAHGVFQLWRFFSHARRGLIPGASLATLPFGMLLTLDNWLEVAANHRELVFDKAHSKSDLDGNISVVDRRPVVICHVHDLETTLEEATDSSFYEAVEKLATEPQYHGWHLNSVHHRSPGSATRNTSFVDNFPVPASMDWWQEIQTAIKVRQSGFSTIWSKDQKLS